MLNERNWQRDLLKILLYAAGVIITMIAIPTFFTVLFTLIQVMSSASGNLSDPMSMVQVRMQGAIAGMGWLMIVQPIVQIFAGLLLARWSGWLAVTVYPFHAPDDEKTPSQT